MGENQYVSVKMESGLVRKLRLLKTEHGISRSWVIRRALVQYLEQGGLRDDVAALNQQEAKNSGYRNN